ncbi:MAG: lysophospholipid acyltransferase family protein [Candidatus Omnitrophica bacterium]|nr:lysophospholipid acyltransferase family protein [Candidatus Omnitrophota bacterium]
MGYVLQFYIVQALVIGLRLVPFALSGWLVTRAADLYFVCSPKRRNIALANLTIAYGHTRSAEQKRTIARRSFENQALSILELLVVTHMKRNAARRFSITGQQHFDEAVARGHGVVFVASHLGSWEYIGFPGYLAHFPHAVIVKTLKNPHLDRMIDALRRATDTVPIPKDASALRRTLAELRQNHGVAIVIDQWAGSAGLWVEFFGQATSTTSLPARLANKTGCALIPIYCIRTAIGHYEIHMLPAVPLPRDPAWEIRTTQRLNDVLESQIRAYPEQWSWGHRRWRPQPLAAE